MIKNFDGNSVGVINLENKLLFTYEMLFEYSNLWKSSGLSMKAYWEQRIERYELCGDDVVKEVKDSYRKFTSAVVLFMKLHEYPSARIFRCCDARRLVMDGTNCSIKKIYLEGKRPVNYLGNKFIVLLFL